MGLLYNPTAKKWSISRLKVDNDTSRPTNLPTNLPTNYPDPVFTSAGPRGGIQYDAAQTERNRQLNRDNAVKNQNNATQNELNRKLNEEAARINAENTKKNQTLEKALIVVSGTKGGDYLPRRDFIRNLENLSSQEKNLIEQSFNTFYQTEKVQRWDSRLGAKPPYGDFDPNYYKSVAPAAVAQWQKAVQNNDLDILGRYTENDFYLQHYTTQGKAAGLRGNPVEKKLAVERYVEKAPTDADLQAARALQLGVDTATQADRLVAIPEVSAEWEKAKAGDSYWTDLAKKNYLDVNKKDEFAALFRLSQRPEDKQVAFNYNANAGYGITELEDALNQAVGEKATVDVKKFGALTQDVLRQTIDEMKKAKAREQEISMFSGLGSFSEIMDINKELSNSILGDTGIGGVLSFMGGNKAEESLEKALRGVTGVNNSTIYNWQQWFDEKLKTRYEQDLELGLTADEASEKVRIESEFARNFIDQYLIPRFNESRSMNEFVEYLDVRQEEQNPFQTQDAVNAAKLIADLKAQQFLDQLKQTPERYFDSNFYFSPTGDKAREAAYAEQARTVNADWEAAKKGDAYWAQQAYRFGVNINDKDAFARMHFQVKGQGKGYDAADDILNASKVSTYIYDQILPALKEEALKQGTIFGQFIRPDEFADEMLRGLDPNDKATWDEVLKRYGIEDFKGTVDDLKAYITEALRTGSAQEIREQIKYLNEKRKKPTQEILGVTYIERPEDYKDEQAKPETELYKVFQSAGFQGTEDEFYENFFPDIDRSEQAVLTKAGTGEALKMEGFNFSDPYASLASIEDLLADDEDDEDLPKADRDIFSTSYFKLDDEDVYSPTKSKSGQAFLGEFTSMFKL